MNVNSFALLDDSSPPSSSISSQFKLKNQSSNHSSNGKVNSDGNGLEATQDDNSISSDSSSDEDLLSNEKRLQVVGLVQRRKARSQKRQLKKQKKQKNAIQKAIAIATTKEDVKGKMAKDNQQQQQQLEGENGSEKKLKKRKRDHTADVKSAANSTASTQANGSHSDAAASSDATQAVVVPESSNSSDIHQLDAQSDLDSNSDSASDSDQDRDSPAPAPSSTSQSSDPTSSVASSFSSLISESDFSTTLRVLTHLSTDLELFYTLPNFRVMRNAMYPMLKAHLDRYKAEKQQADRKVKKKLRQEHWDFESLKRKKEKDMDRDSRNQSKIRAARLKKLEQLEMEQDGETGSDEEGTGKKRVKMLMRVPDGVADGWDGNNQTMENILKIEHQQPSVSSSSTSTTTPSVASSTSTSTSNNNGKVEVNDEMLDEPDASKPIDVSFTTSTNAKTGETIRELNSSIKCYICKQPFKLLHHFYDSLCPTCADFNFLKRNLTCDLTSRIALVTGARVKIGYRILLKLLRANAVVIATTRFPIDLTIRLSHEKDYEQWKHHLHIYGLDFRNLSSIESFCSFLYQQFPYLDIIINNACQTVRRPPAFYQHLVERERVDYEMLNENVKRMLKGHVDFQVNELHTIGRGDGNERLKLQNGTMGNGIENGEKKENGSENGKGKVQIEEMMDESKEEEVEEINVSATTELKPNHSSLSSAAVVIPLSSSSAASSSSSSLPASSPTVPANSTNTKKLSRRQAVAAQKRKAEEAAAAVAKAAEATEAAKLSNSVPTSSSSSSSSSSLLLSSALLPSLPSSFTSISSDASQFPLIPSDSQTDPSHFPVNRTDVNGQQVDLRQENSWRLELADISTGEIAEVMAINVMAPFILNGKLKNLMRKSKHEWKFIVNVSAMEGKFYRYKTSRHPHTNSAKAALNMMTRTSAQDYAKDKIFMTAVDTGWINDENPVHIAVKIAAKYNFQTPLDEVDAASRVIDPIFAPLAEKQQNPNNKDIRPSFGFFLKDFVKCEW